MGVKPCYQSKCVCAGVWAHACVCVCVCVSVSKCARCVRACASLDLLVGVCGHMILDWFVCV